MLIKTSLEAKLIYHLKIAIVNIRAFPSFSKIFLQFLLFDENFDSFLTSFIKKKKAKEGRRRLS
ncbi:MAG: hypothetical protein B5M54_01215 [Candidatus Aminicenantes bacterium 4484_214]|nr:MAG: hypothetical protein B5M54_01215 [Candidatus Aminicenantes bacterium 4484_214]